MGPLLLGVLALGVVLLLLRLFAAAPPATVRNTLLVLGGGLVLLVAVALLVTGRGGQVLWGLVVFAPMLWRWWQAGHLGRFFRAPAPPEDSVTTAWLAMRLDHANGEMSGRVLAGTQAGRELAELDLPALLALLAECQAQDPDSVPLLEAWLDRAWPDWRSVPPPAAPQAGPMDRAEALAVLGLAAGASVADIRAAHRRLMQAAHPDHGGSDWMAARLNQARDILLRD